jgi:hypothetical protein
MKKLDSEPMSVWDRSGLRKKQDAEHVAVCEGGLPRLPSLPKDTHPVGLFFTWFCILKTHDIQSSSVMS